MKLNSPDALDSIRIEKPCDADWEKMRGDAKARHCSQCALNVYDISGLTRGEALELVRQHEGKMCLRFYRREDGRVLTRDCAAARMAQAGGAALGWFAMIFMFALLGALWCLRPGGKRPEELARDAIRGMRQTPVYRVRPVANAIDWIDRQLTPPPLGQPGMGHWVAGNVILPPVTLGRATMGMRPAISAAPGSSSGSPRNP